MNPFQISQDPAWHRWVDGLILLFIGFLAGVVVIGSIALSSRPLEAGSVNNLRRSPMIEPIEITDKSSPSVRVEEI